MKRAPNLGGGALGAYQAGVYEALHEAGIEHQRPTPDSGHRERVHDVDMGGAEPALS